MIRRLNGIIVGAGRAGAYLQRGALLSSGADIIAYVDIHAEQARDPAMQTAVGRGALERQTASTNTLSRFDTEVLDTKENLTGMELNK